MTDAATELAAPAPVPAATAPPAAPPATDPPATAPPPVMEPVIGDDGIADFTIVRKPVRIRVDGDVFDAARALPALELMALQGVVQHLQTASTPEEQTKVVMEVFGKILLPESLTRFADRLRSMAEPIDARQFTGITRWLMSKYAGRPTTQPSGSSTGSGSPDGGTSSTASSPPPASTPSPSPPDGS